MFILPVTATVHASFRSARAEARGAWMSLVTVLALAVILTGCATTKAATVIEGPPLAVPKAPERVFVPAEEEPLAATAVGPDTPLASVPRVQPSPLPKGGRLPVRADSETRSEAAQPATSVATPNPGGTTEANRELRVVPSSTEVAPDQQRVKNLIDKVTADLKNVVPSKLSKNDADNLRESQRLLAQADRALKERNVNFALVVAEKAAELAATLPGR
jgi:hypothetical protein